MHGRGVLVMADGKRSVIVDRKRGAVLIFVLFANPCLNGGERKADTRANGSTTRNTGKAFLPIPTGTGAMIAAQQKCAFVPWPVVLAPLTMYTSIAVCGHADTRGGGANCMHGQGTFDDSMGWCYTGGFERDQPTRGVLRAADGQIYSVTYATNCGFIWNGPTPMIKVAV